MPILPWCPLPIPGSHPTPPLCRARSCPSAPEDPPGSALPHCFHRAWLMPPLWLCRPGGSQIPHTGEVREDLVHPCSTLLRVHAGLQELKWLRGCLGPLRPLDAANAGGRPAAHLPSATCRHQCGHQCHFLPCLTRVAINVPTGREWVHRRHSHGDCKATTSDSR